MAGGRTIVFAGGMPLERDGVLVGAVGVSGGDAAQDQRAVDAGVAAFARRLGGVSRSGGDDRFREPRVGGQQRRLVGALPRQVEVRPAEVAVRRGLAVDRPAQVERRDDRRRTQVEMALDERLDRRVVDLGRSRTSRR